MGEPGGNSGVYGVYNEGDFERTSTNHTEIINDGGKKDGPVMGVYNAKGAKFKEDRKGGKSLVGQQQSPNASAKSNEEQQGKSTNSGSSTGQAEQELSTIRIQIRLIALHEVVRLSFPENAKVKDVVDRIEKEKGIRVELRIKTETDERKLEDPDKTLSEEKVESGALLLAYKLEVIEQRCIPALNRAGV